MKLKFVIFIVSIIASVLLLSSCRATKNIEVTQRDSIYIDRYVELLKHTIDTVEIEKTVIEYVRDSMGNWVEDRRATEQMRQISSAKEDLQSEAKNVITATNETNLVAATEKGDRWNIFYYGVVAGVVVIVLLQKFVST